MKNIHKFFIILCAIFSTSIAHAQTAQSWNIRDVNLQTINSSTSPFRFYGGNTLLTAYDSGMRLNGNAFGLALPSFMSSPDVYWLGAYRPAGGSTVTTNGLLIDGNAVWLHPAVGIRAKARFTAPSTGQYSFSGQFQVSQSGMISGVQVVYNSQTVTIMNPRQVQTFSFTRGMADRRMG